MGMPARKLEYLSPAHELADRLLAQMAYLKKELSQIQAEAEAELTKVRERYQAKISALTAEIKALDKEIKALAKKKRAEFFDGVDRVELEHGALLYHAEWRVKKARGVLKKLEELGWEEAIKVSKSVKWDVLEKWPDEKLFLVGTERRLKESFGYELYE